MVNKSTTGSILLFGLLVTIIFSIYSQGSGYETRTFVALATAQGAFIGIVFSIFILASQVSATQFTPLTLEQLSNSTTFTALLGFYVVSILLNISFIQSRVTGFYLPVIPDNWNLSVGLAAGLASISFLSLIIARQLLASLTSPDKLLDQTASSISPEDLSGEVSNEELDTLKPSRSSLLTIERILSSAADREDEYTVQYASYSMYSAISRLVDPSANSKRSMVLGNKWQNSDINTEILIERWETCVKIAQEGPIDRTFQVFRIHRRLLESFLRGDNPSIAESQIDNFTKLHLRCISENYLKTELLEEYRELSQTAVGNGDYSVVTQLNSQLCTLSVQTIEKMGDQADTLSSARRDVYTGLITTVLQNLDDVMDSENVEQSSVRELTDQSLRYIDDSINDSFSHLESVEDWSNYRRNILNDIFQAITEVNSDPKRVDEITYQRMILAQVSLCCSLDKNGADVLEQMIGKTEEKSFLRDRVIALDKGLTEGSVDPYELTSIGASDIEIEDFVRRMAISAQESK